MQKKESICSMIAGVKAKVGLVKNLEIEVQEMLSEKHEDIL